MNRHIGLYGATMVGISAMLGAGIFVLSGVALRTAGPGALLTFAISGLLALITAFSFAELASAFPESGGSYVFAKRVFPIGGAFAAGWVLWLAYIVAAALYALGFGSFARLGAESFGFAPPPWVEVATAAGILLAAFGLQLRGGASSGDSVTIGKVVAFLVLLVPGFVLLAQQPVSETLSELRPFLPEGLGAVMAAMTFTFIALEGFEVIAALAGEIKRPQKTIPRAMFLSIGITLSMYLGLLFLLLTLGGSGERPAWQELGELGDQAVAAGVERYLGRFGHWVVVVAGLLATFTALSSALLAASRASHSMALDRALPRNLAKVDGGGTPRLALFTSLGLAVALVVGTGDVEMAGATASLIFLLSFALTNGAGLLVRVRGGVVGETYKAPLYPVFPLLGITGCLALAAVQVGTAPLATLVGAGWLALGVVLYQLMFRARAETMSARAEALDADLVRLRGREPLVLVPIARPERAETLVTLAHTLAPPEWGKVLALSVIRHDAEQEQADVAVETYRETTQAMANAVRAASRARRRFEGTLRVEADVAQAIARTVSERKPETLLLGMTSLDRPENTEFLERVVAGHLQDVAIFNPRTAAPFDLADVKKILVPLAGGSGHDPLRARVLGLLERSQHRDVTLMRVVRSEAERSEAEEHLAHLAEDIHAHGTVVEVSENPVEPLLRHAREHDLVIIGLSRRPDAPLFGHVVRLVAQDPQTSVLMIARTLR